MGRPRQERHVSLPDMAKLVEVPPQEGPQSSRVQDMRTGTPYSENVMVATVVVGPRRRSSSGAGTFVPRGKRSLKESVLLTRTRRPSRSIQIRLGR